MTRAGRTEPPANDLTGRTRAVTQTARLPTGEWRNGRRAGLRSRCRVSGVEVRPLSRLPARCGRDGDRSRRAPPPYTSRAMQITATPAPKAPSSLEIELPPERLDRAVDDAVRAPRAPDARPRLPARQGARGPSSSASSARGPSSTTPSTTSSRPPIARPSIEQDILPLTNADVEVVQAEEGKPLIFKATVQVRPEVKLGDYQRFNFGPEIDTIDDPRVDQVLEELRDQNATSCRSRTAARRTATTP